MEIKDLLKQKHNWRKMGRDLCRKLGIELWAGSPKFSELEYLFSVLEIEKPKRVLSCGMGCTTKILNYHKPEVFVAVENKPPKVSEAFDEHGNEVTGPWKENIEKLEKEIPNLIRYENWREVNGTYDCFFLDSSAGINGWEGCRQHHRHDCLCYAMPLLRNNALVIVHDYQCRINQQVDKILESFYFKFVDKFCGIGVFRICKKWWLERGSPKKKHK